MRRRRGRLDLLLAVGVVLVVAAAALHHTASGSSSSAAPPSPRAALVGFARRYLAVLDGGRASSLPASTGSVRSAAAQSGQIPPRSRAGALRLAYVRFSYVSDATRASALVTGRDRRHSYPFQLTLRYESGSWVITYLVAPDLEQILRRSYPAAPAPGGLRLAATRFALAYADYRAGLARMPPSGASTIERQIQQHKDPLAATTLTHSRPRLVSLKLGPPANGLAAASAALRQRAGRVSFAFVLQRVAGRWQPFAFPESAG